MRVGAVAQAAAASGRSVAVAASAEAARHIFLAIGGVSDRHCDRRDVRGPTVLVVDGVVEGVRGPCDALVRRVGHRSVTVVHRRALVGVLREHHRTQVEVVPVRVEVVGQDVDRDRGVHLRRTGVVDRAGIVLVVVTAVAGLSDEDLAARDVRRRATGVIHRVVERVRRLLMFLVGRVGRRPVAVVDQGALVRVLRDHD